MRKLILLLFIALFPLASLAGSVSNKEVHNENFTQGNLTLESVLKSVPEVASFAPCKGVAQFAGKIYTINKVRYELRIFFFEDVNDILRDVSFYQFCKENKLLKTKSKVMDQGYGPIEFFSSTIDIKLKGRGIHFLLSLRKIN